MTSGWSSRSGSVATTGHQHAPWTIAARRYGAAMAPHDQPVVVYTDGACSGNPGPGGWAWAVSPAGVPRESGGEPVTTNQRMEITAALEAVRALSPESADGRPVEVVSDSTYVVNCFRDKWYVRWQANGWRNSKKAPVANADLWKPLVELVERGGVSFRWVKGHGDDPMNDLVDQLAVAAIPR
jgi:ribonuclease HI